MKQVGAMALAGMVLFGAGMAGGFMLDQPQVVEKIVKEEVVVPGPVEYVEVPGPVTTVTETVYEQVEVLPESVEGLVEYIVDENGDLSALDLDRIEDYGFDEMVSQYAFITESKLMAADYVKRELADELDKYDFNATVKFDEDDIDRVRVDADLDELVISDVDYEDMDADVRVRARFEHDDVDYEAYFDVEIKDGSVDDIELVSVNKL